MFSDVYNVGTKSGEPTLFRNWIIQKGDNVIIDGWCSCCCGEESEDCSPRFFVIEDPIESRLGGHLNRYIRCACYASGNSDYVIGDTYLKRTVELKRI
jgi:hypothetical protein